MPRIRATESSDPEFHRENLKKHISQLKRENEKVGINYESFVHKLLEIFSDKPPVSWRFLITTYRYPAFRVVSKKSGRTIYFLRLPQDRIIIPHAFVPEQVRHLFPVSKGFYGTAYEAIIDFSTFGEKKQQQYIDAITIMLNQPDIVSLNFAAH